MGSRFMGQLCSIWTSGQWMEEFTAGCQGRDSPNDLLLRTSLDYLGLFTQLLADHVVENRRRLPRTARHPRSRH